MTIENTDEDGLTVWILDAISTAKSPARLMALKRWLKQDVDDGAEYTKDDETMAILRSAWIERAKTIGMNK